MFTHSTHRHGTPNNHMYREHPETNFSFCSASLDLFRKKIPPRPPPLTKPYEVFPGIWSTDATAKVFGYLDSNKPPLSKSTDESLVQRQKSDRQTNLQSPALAKKLLERYREVHADDGTDDCSERTHRQHVEAWDRQRQEKRDEAKRERETSQRSAMRARMRTVSRDDELVQRGANPRTGVVSPESVTDKSRESVGDGQTVVRHRKAPGRRKREGSSKWTQNDLGWSLIESPSFEPSAEVLRKEPGRAVLADKVKDQFVVVMPGVDNPAPAEMTPTQIQQYQERFRDRFTSGRTDPAEVGLRQWMPEGSSNKVQNIPRKEVGSKCAQRNGSTDTVIIQDQTQASSLSTPRKDNMRDRQVRIVTPLSSPTSNSRQCSVFDRNDRGFDPGSDPEKLPSQITNHIKPLGCSKMHHGIDLLPEAKAPNIPTPRIPPSSTSLPPMKYLPRLDFLQPSPISCLTTSYRRPKELQPALLRAVKPVEYTSSEHDTSPNVLSGRGLRIEERTQVKLQNCVAAIPRASFPNSGQERRRENPVHGTQPAITGILPATPKASKTALKLQNQRIHKIRIVPDARVVVVGDGTRTVEKDQVAERKAEERSEAASCSCTKCDRSPSPTAIGLLTSRKGPSPGSAYTAPNPLQNKAGRVPANEDVEKASGGISGAKMKSTTGAQTQSTNMSPHQNSNGPPRLDITGSEWFIGHKANGVHGDRHDEQNKQSRIQGLVQEASTLGIIMGLWRLITLMEQNFYDSIRMRSIQRRLMDMIHHVLLTLHTSSPALEVLRTPNAKMEEYLAALKDVIWAIFYLLVLLNIVMVVRKVLKLAAIAINLIWLPLKLVLLVARWLLLG